MSLADAAKVRFDVGNQLARDGGAVGPVIGRVDLVGIAERPGTVEMNEDHLRVVGVLPNPMERGIRVHHAADVAEACRVAADVNFQRVSPVWLARKIARQDHAGPKIDRPAVEVGEEPRLDLEILDEFGIGRQRLGRNGLGELEAHPRRGSRIELDVDHAG